jgi:hypothetical protein
VDNSTNENQNPGRKPEPAPRPPLYAYADHVVLAQLAIENNGW